MTGQVTRREWLTATAVLGATTATAGASEKGKAEKEPFGYCLNTSTISGQKRKLPEVIDVAARAGYKAIEPWCRDLEAYVKDGGKLQDLAKRLRDNGLSVESSIGFAEWVVEDDARRKKGLEQAKRDMDLVQQLGGTRYAAPPAGATGVTNLNLLKAAERYRALLEAGDKIGIVPQVEVWGFSKALNRLGEAVLVAIESGHPKACVLPDVFHLYKGGSDLGGVRLLNGAAVHVFHFNDYPAKPPRAEINDSYRVYPGDGVAPLTKLLQNLRQAGIRCWLSLELFNPGYWKLDALEVARTGLEKMKAVVKNSLT